MTRHRFRELVQQRVEWDRDQPAVVSMDGFVVCPLAVQQWLSERPCQWDVYQRAWQQALELAQPSVLERYETALWN